jgi:riboflavin synthase
MFTGIVETVGKVALVSARGETTRLSIDAPAIADSVKIGDSVSVNGGCLTVVAVQQGRLDFDAIRETLDRTALGGLRAGSRVNLERAMRADARLDGHIAGPRHETGRVRALRRRGEMQLFIDCSRAFADWLIPRDGLSRASRSPWSASARVADVALIPHTLATTTLGGLTGGERVNLEADVLGKYVKRYSSACRHRGSMNPLGATRCALRLPDNLLGFRRCALLCLRDEFAVRSRSCWRSWAPARRSRRRRCWSPRRRGSRRGSCCSGPPGRSPASAPIWRPCSRSASPTARPPARSASGPGRSAAAAGASCAC